jgi:hypothetical protein
MNTTFICIVNEKGKVVKEQKEFPEKQFRRLKGLQRGTFEKMVSVLLEY